MVKAPSCCRGCRLHDRDPQPDCSLQPRQHDLAKPAHGRAQPCRHCRAAPRGAMPASNARRAPKRRSSVPGRLAEARAPLAGDGERSPGSGS